MEKKEANAVIMHNQDNVVTATSDIKKGEIALIKLKEGWLEVPTMDNISFGHKLAIKQVKLLEAIIKYGEIIGSAKEEIQVGEHVHVHNVESLRGRRREK